ncbi:hypothetical protein K439DRAFT_1403596 [Ramaria rubella]|nr:hypothetical protein K439DRAFT_1403596 [Ramaria rubella]
MLLARAGGTLVGTAPLRRLAEQTRSIHIPRRIGAPTPSASTLIQRTRALFTRLITHIEGQAVPISRSVHSTPSIRQSLSLPARIALSKPLKAPCLPRAPRVPGNVTQVGLGTARNFSTGRPIFQHLVENVPVAGRAFYEIDWDLEMRKEKNLKIRRPNKNQHEAKLADKLTPVSGFVGGPPLIANDSEELQHYFETPSAPLVTTYLQIPLAPTPTSRVPLTDSPSSPRLLPLPALAKEHASHSKHAIRVSSLFRRLDAARVWERGASCQTYGDRSGLCTILRIKFDGWSEDMVRNVLGHAGKGWCTIQEFRIPDPNAQAGVQYASSMLATATQVSSPEPMSCGNNSSSGISFVMPTLDFSSSFASTCHSPSTWSTIKSDSSQMPDSDVESDYSFPSAPESTWSDEASMIDSSAGNSLSSSREWSSSVPTSDTSSPNWLSFSSDFASKASYHQGDIFQ